METIKSGPVCPKCQNEGMIKDANGTIHICFDCLASGRLDQHDKKIREAKDFGIRL